MATFVFKAMDLAGVPAGGEVEANSKQDVADQLKERGLIVIDIATKYRSKELNVDLFAHVKPADLAVATRQLSTMVTSGMTILRSLYVLENQTKSKLLCSTFTEVRHDVEAGLLLSDALERHPKVFSACTSRWSERGRPAACSSRHCSGPPTSLRRTRRCDARSARR